MQSAVKYLVIALCFLLTSCFIGPVKELSDQIEESWSDDAPTNATPLKNDIVNNFVININWKQNLGNNIYPYNKFSICNEAIFVSNSDKEIFSFNKTNGKILWKNFLNSPITSGISCDSNNLYFVTLDGFAWAVNNHGKLLWKYFIGPVYSQPLIAKENVVFKTITYEFYSINIISGSKNWVYQSVSPPLTIKTWAKLNFSEGIVYSGLPGGKCLALDINSGALVWESTYSQPKGSSEIERANDSTSMPIIEGPFLYIVASKGNLATLDKKTGKQMWSRNLSSFYGLGLQDDFIYVIHDSGSLYSLSKDTGKSIWRNAEYIGRDSKHINFFDKFILIDDFEGYVHFIEKNTGKTNSRFKLAEDTIMDLFVEENKIYILSQTGELIMAQIEINDSQQISINTDADLQNKKENSMKETNDKSILDDLIFWN